MHTGFLSQNGSQNESIWIPEILGILGSGQSPVNFICHLQMISKNLYADIGRMHMGSPVDETSLAWCLGFRGYHAAAPIACSTAAWRHVDAQVDGQLAMHFPLPVTRQANVTRPTNDTQ